ncbi:MAG: hypothetical protein M3Y50_02955 [Acidobacteriota bacterium]|nr:hypothetical protein [Acidobacteriota bacterium]
MNYPILAVVAIVALTVASAAPPALHAQARDIPSAAPVQLAGETQEQRGHKLLDQCLQALGGQAWLNRKNVQLNGHIGRFFRGQPTGIVIDFTSTHRIPNGTHPEAERIGFITDKSMILPGKKIDIVQLWTEGHGYEVTYKGKTELPADQVADFYRRQAHSIESIYSTWLKAPGVAVVYEGTSMVERRLADKVTVLSDNNDAVTLELDATTHLPLRRTFEWRNKTFQDHDEDAEEYEDYHTVQGLPTAYSVTRYRNGDMVSQTFLTRIAYDVELPPDYFTIGILLKKK